MAAPLTSPRPPCWHWALCAEGTATLGGLLHLLGKGGPVAALKGELPPLQPQALAAALARAQAPALHPRQWARGLADGIAPLDLVKVPDRVPPASDSRWDRHQDKASGHTHGSALPGAAGGGGRGRGERRGSLLERGPLALGPHFIPSILPARHAHAQASSWAHREVKGERRLSSCQGPTGQMGCRLGWAPCS